LARRLQQQQNGDTMRNALKTFVIGVAGAIALGTGTPVHAASIPVLTAAVKNTAADDVTEVRWRRGWGWGPGIGLGIAGAVLAGAALAGGPYWHGGYPVYGGGYYPAYGGYYPPPYPYIGPYGGYYGYRGCVTDDGYGRFRSCDRP
jgi:hypothetical protein